jgi:hypothetical protein
VSFLLPTQSELCDWGAAATHRAVSTDPDSLPAAWRRSSSLAYFAGGESAIDREREERPGDRDRDGEWERNERESDGERQKRDPRGNGETRKRVERKRERAENREKREEKR